MGEAADFTDLHAMTVRTSSQYRSTLSDSVTKVNIINMVYNLAPGSANFMPSRFFLSMEKLIDGDPSLLANAGRDDYFALSEDSFISHFPSAVEHFSREGASTPGNFQFFSD